jgi:hypothetical protein
MELIGIYLVKVPRQNEPSALKQADCQQFVVVAQSSEIAANARKHRLAFVDIKVYSCSVVLEDHTCTISFSQWTKRRLIWTKR